MKSARNTLLLALSLVALSALGLPAHSQQYESLKYRIESGSLIIQPEINSDQANYDAVANFGSGIKKRFEDRGYMIVNHSDKNSSGKPFIRLKLDKSQLVFDTTESQGESVQMSTANLSGNGATAFMLTLRQEGQFKNSYGAVIAPTYCDFESDRCTPLLAKLWKKTYGFGYRITNSGMKDFTDANAYRSLFTEGQTETAAIIYDGALGQAGKELGLQFKLRPQLGVQKGIYKGTVIITATAGY